MSDVDLAYLAGVIDSDGYVTATRSERKGRLYFGAQIGITGSCRAPHDLAAALFGGNVNTHRPSRNPNYKPQHHWQLGGRRAVPAIEAVLPYLRVKHARAELVLELQRDLDEAREFAAEGGVPWLPVGYDRARGFSAQVDEIRTLDGRTCPARVA